MRRYQYELFRLEALPPCGEEEPTLPAVETDTPPANLRPTEQVAGSDDTFSNGPDTSYIAFRAGLNVSNSFYRTALAQSGPAGGPLAVDPINPVNANASSPGFVGGVEASWPLLNLLSPPALPPLLLPTKAPPKPFSPLPPITFNVEAGVYGFAGGTATINGIPGGPGITPTGADSLNFRDDFMFTTGGAVVFRPASWWSAALTGGFAGLVERATFNCVTFCVNGAVVPTFSASKEIFVPGAYVGARFEWPLPVRLLRGAKFALDYKHVFAFSENVSLGSVAQGRIVSFNTAQNLDLITAGVSIPFRW